MVLPDGAVYITTTSPPWRPKVSSTSLLARTASLVGSPKPPSLSRSKTPSPHIPPITVSTKVAIITTQRRWYASEPHFANKVVLLLWWAISRPSWRFLHGVYREKTVISGRAAEPL